MIRVACVLLVAALGSATESGIARAADLGTAPAAIAATTGCGASGVPTDTLYLPNITKTLGGPLGWDTPFYIQNAGPVQTTVEVTFYRFSDGAAVACRRTTALAPGTSMVDDPGQDTYLADDTQYSVVARSFGAPIVGTVTQLQGTGATTEALSYAGSSTGATTVYLPNVTRRFYGYDVPFIIQNLGVTTATVSARFISFDGTQQLTVRRVIDPGRSKVVDPDSDDPVLGAPGLFDGTQYAVTLTASQPIAVVANASDEAIGPVAFSLNGLAEGATTLYAPYAVKQPGGLFSPIVVQNVGSASADATLTFSPLAGGAASQSFVLKAIEPGGSRAFDPRFSLGTTAPCATAVPGVCLGSGEYALTIRSVVPVAAVVLPNATGTAAGYVATTTLRPRSILPIVMRTVGGAAGWTTSLLIERGTATQATLRYYALSTGALATTQSLALGTFGTRIDPRGVAGLADDTAYSVTIDGDGGSLAAIAYQQAFTGGDASMMYEGFGGASLPATPQPASVRLSLASDTIVAGASEQFGATVYDQFGIPLAGAPTAWSVSPASLGTISPAGLLATSAVDQLGTVTATSGMLSTSTTLSVVVPRPMTVGGLPFLLTAAPSIDLYADPSLSVMDMQRIVAQSVSDVAEVESDYATRYTHRPVVYVLPNSSSFSTAVQEIGGGPAPSSWAAGLCSCSGEHSWIFLDWHLEAPFAQIRDLRHELTHAIEHELAPNAFYPAWFDEGNARMEEFSIAGTGWLATEQRYRAVSMAAQGHLFTLAEISSPDTWAGRPELEATYEYAVASQSVSLLRSEIGMSGEIALFDRMARGATFEDAYAAVAGHAFSDFANSVAGIIGAFATSYPGIVTAPDTPVGPGLDFAIYGLPPNATFILSIVGNNGYSLAGSGWRAADAYGYFGSYIASGWPAGTYTITATWAGGTISVAGAKTSSLDGPAMLDGEPSSAR